MKRKVIEVKVPGATLQFVRRNYYSGYGREYSQAPRMYVRVEDETILDNLENRKRRPYNVYKTLIHSSGISSVLNLEGFRWSQKAGCSCPCSPGFILPHQSVRVDDEYLNPFDVWVILDGAPSVDETKPARVLAGL